MQKEGNSHQDSVCVSFKVLTCTFSAMVAQLRLVAFDVGLLDIVHDLHYTADSRREVGPCRACNIQGLYRIAIFNYTGVNRLRRRYTAKPAPPYVHRITSESHEVNKEVGRQEHHKRVNFKIFYKKMCVRVHNYYDILTTDLSKNKLL